MTGLRHILMRHRRLAALLAALALCLKALLPAGYMLEMTGTTITVEVCHGQGVETMQIALPAKQDGSAAKQAQDSNHCPYSALSMGALGGADPLLLAAALAFLLLLGFAPVSPPALQRIAFATPPLRGPPLPA